MDETRQRQETGGEDAEERDSRQQQIVDMGSATIKTEKGTIHTLTIVGQIEGHQILPPTSKSTKYEHVMPLLASVEESDEVDGLLILLNTVGGDIEAGLAISELISSMRKPTVSLVLGGGHSIGVPLAVSAKVSFIAPSAAMTIHPVRLSGTVIGVSQTFNYFERIQDRIITFVTRNSRVKREDFTKLMLQTGELAADIGSVIYGEQAVQLGLIDRIGGLADAAGMPARHDRRGAAGKADASGVRRKPRVSPARGSTGRTRVLLRMVRQAGPPGRVGAPHKMLEMFCPVW